MRAEKRLIYSACVFVLSIGDKRGSWKNTQTARQGLVDAREECWLSWITIIKLLWWKRWRIYIWNHEETAYLFFSHIIIHKIGISYIYNCWKLDEIKEAKFVL